MIPLVPDHFPASILCQWHITDRCNLQCTHCYQDSPAYEPSRDELAATLVQMEEFIASCRNAASPKPFRT